MNIHEYQAKALLSQYGVNVAAGAPAFNGSEAVDVARKLGGWPCAVKAQIHAGGRGKAGGVKIAHSADEVKAYADELLGKILVTPQTGANGKQVNRLYIEQGCAIARELYFSMLIDRTTSRITIIASHEGGMDIEALAETAPEKITRLTIDPVTNMMPHHIRALTKALKLEAEAAKQAKAFFPALYKAFIKLDASLIEINPLVITDAGDLLALDAKMSFDDNALFRQQHLLELRDLDEEDPSEVNASKFGLSYIKLDGNIGCMVNGAGLAMATMDIIQQNGGTPANFLDVGGSATAERVTEAFKIILSDPNVEGILVNIFGGIMRCDVIAEGVVQAVKTLGLKQILVVRLQGTNAQKGREIMDQADLSIITAETLGEAAQKITHAVKGI